MKFYDCLTAPSPRRVRMFIAEKGVTLETKMVDLANGEHLTDAFEKINPIEPYPYWNLMMERVSLIRFQSVSIWKGSSRNRI
jgi:Glutathione S-transferase, N-terminal domain